MTLDSVRTYGNPRFPVVPDSPSFPIPRRSRFPVVPVFVVPDRKYAGGAVSGSPQARHMHPHRGSLRAVSVPSESARSRNGRSKVPQRRGPHSSRDSSHRSRAIPSETNAPPANLGAVHGQIPWIAFLICSPFALEMSCKLCSEPPLPRGVARAQCLRGRKRSQLSVDSGLSDWFFNR